MSLTNADIEVFSQSVRNYVDPRFKEINQILEILLRERLKMAALISALDLKMEEITAKGDAGITTYGYRFRKVGR